MYDICQGELCDDSRRCGRADVDGRGVVQARVLSSPTDDVEWPRECSIRPPKRCTPPAGGRWLGCTRNPLSPGTSHLWTPLSVASRNAWTSFHRWCHLRLGTVAAVLCVWRDWRVDVRESPWLLGDWDGCGGCYRGAFEYTALVSEH